MTVISYDVFLAETPLGAVFGPIDNPTLFTMPASGTSAFFDLKKYQGRVDLDDMFQFVIKNSGNKKLENELKAVNIAEWLNESGMYEDL